MSIKRRGDTLIEVMLAVAVFAILTVITINLMNSGISSAQHTLEITMARNEIDNQAEAIRYIHQSYVAERQLDKTASQFRTLWDALRRIAQAPHELEDDELGIDVVFDINKLSACSEAYKPFTGMVKGYSAFILNTRLILPDAGTKYDGTSYDAVLKDIVVGIQDEDIDVSDPSRRLVEAPLYPRIVYRSVGDTSMDREIKEDTTGTISDNTSGSLAEKQIFNRVERAEGIFIIVVGDNEMKPERSNYYDFYIRSCWHSVGAIAPSTLTTIVRLYNPEVIE